jgi:hypothetical protein
MQPMWLPPLPYLLNCLEVAFSAVGITFIRFLESEHKSLATRRRPPSRNQSHLAAYPAYNISKKITLLELEKEGEEN